MKIKYNRTSSVGQEGARFDLDTQTYDEVLFDKGVSGKVPFKERPEAKRLVQSHDGTTRENFQLTANTTNGESFEQYSKRIFWFYARIAKLYQRHP